MKKKNTTRVSETDWERVRNMRDEDIDFSDLPEVTPEMFANAIVRKGFKPLPNKQQITLRIDQDVITFFREQGQGYQTKINQLLRAYMDAHKAAR
ncbi:MAG TPA: BrnA antitoxin family protein [Pyrinomonadaceae bacterium]|nr:BrnA antitoxin family protein [Pyrinomonadaceae bacterium]